MQKYNKFDYSKVNNKSRKDKTNNYSYDDEKLIKVKYEILATTIINETNQIIQNSMRQLNELNETFKFLAARRKILTVSKYHEFRGAIAEISDKVNGVFEDVNSLRCSINTPIYGELYAKVSYKQGMYNERIENCLANLKVLSIDYKKSKITDDKNYKAIDDYDLSKF